MKPPTGSTSCSVSVSVGGKVMQLIGSKPLVCTTRFVSSPAAWPCTSIATALGLLYVDVPGQPANVLGTRGETLQLPARRSAKTAPLQSAAATASPDGATASRAALKHADDLPSSSVCGVAASAEEPAWKSRTTIAGYGL